ncbi:MAG: hypothetical protein LW822_10280 [Phycisphaeraceae bacterium]|jgi:hypothetical protein|nr:hypothetical protein [Phycisphaeraceae bacterium]
MPGFTELPLETLGALRKAMDGMYLPAVVQHPSQLAREDDRYALVYAAGQHSVYEAVCQAHAAAKAARRESLGPDEEDDDE